MGSQLAAASRQILVIGNRRTPASALGKPPSRLLMITRNTEQIMLLTAENAAGRRPGECSWIFGSYNALSSSARHPAPCPGRGPAGTPRQ